jgi:hypothetical protein
LFLHKPLARRESFLDEQQRDYSNQYTYGLEWAAGLPHEMRRTLRNWPLERARFLIFLARGRRTMEEHLFARRAHLPLSPRTAGSATLRPLALGRSRFKRHA